MIGIHVVRLGALLVALAIPAGLLFGLPNAIAVQGVGAATMLLGAVLCFILGE
jgi:hypothetical protein